MAELQCVWGCINYQTVLHLETPYKMVESENCGLRRTFPLLSGVTGTPRQRPGYIEKESEEDSSEGARSHRKDQISFKKVTEIKRFVSSGRLLEIGCGGGRLSSIASNNGLHAVGIDMDFSPFQTRPSSAKELGLLAADVSNMPFQATSFDAITLHHTLEHLENPLDCLGEIYSAIKPGGFFFLSVPNHKALMPRLIKATLPGYIPWSHRWHFSHKTLSSLVEQSGFRIVRLLRHESMDTPNMESRAKHSVYRALNLVQTLVGMGDNICLVAERD